MEKQHLFTTQSLACSNPTSFGMEMQSSNDFNPGFLIPHWDNPVDQNDPFESALSSIVSSPIHGFGNDHRSVNNDAAGSMITELLGKLRDVNTNVATSCYSSNTTPSNSPPKKNLSMFDVSNNRLNPVCSSGPEFAERVARFSSYGTGLHPQFMSKNMVSGVNGGDSTKVNVGSGVKNAEFGDPKEVSSISEQIPSRDLNIRGSNNTNNDANSRKRKSVSKGKAMENQASSVSNSEAKNVESGEKRSKIDEAKDEQKGNKKQIKEDSKPEPPKDYIHVRARRGQATDSHSLAERVRREKISERMKFLQDLVPGCNKVTGKAVMLDEIINYVQSLQRQVEFLSMKLATVNPRLDFNVEALLSKVCKLQAFHHPGSIQNTPFSLDLGMPTFPFSFQALQQGLPSQNCASSNVETQFSMNPLSSAAEPSQTMQFPLLGAFGDSACQVPALFEDDLHNVVQMGFSRNQQQSFQDSVYATEMKIEQ